MRSDKVSIFISRELDSNSELNEFSASISAYLDDFSLIEFTQIPFIPPRERWLFFYSKSGVRYFFNQIESEFDITKYKFASFGPSTGKYLESRIGKSISFCGNTDTNEVTSSLVELIGMDSICFVVGKQSLRSVQSILPKTISSSEIIVYNNQPLTNVELRQYDIAIITSPMNASTFLKQGGRAEHYISIGSTTSESMIQLGLSAIQAPHPSEAGLNIILKSVYKDFYYANTK